MSEPRNGPGLPWRTVGLSLVALLLIASAVPAPFTIDEVHYLTSVIAVRSGMLDAPWTAHLPATAALASFDPAGFVRHVRSTPISPTVPPGYGYLAAPILGAGWRGLVALNVIAFMVTLAVVSRLTVALGGDRRRGALAAAAWGLGGFAIEYSQGLWPHCLSLAFVTAAVLAGVRSLRSPHLGFASGVLVGLAIGFRYQNVAVAFAIIGWMLWKRRTRSALWLLVGLCGPLAVWSATNKARLDSWSPVSKGPRYAALANLRPAAMSVEDRARDALRTVWFRVVDYRARPLLDGHGGVMERHWPTGALSTLGVPRKSLLQSAPWVALAALAWAGLALPSRKPEGSGLILAVTLCTVAMFAAAGSTRTSGIAFNPRYLLELPPLLAPLVALALPSSPNRVLLYGLVTGSTTVAALRVADAQEWGKIVALVPLLGALALVGSTIVAQRRPKLGPIAVWLASACVGWSAGIHLVDDLNASRSLRRTNQATAEELKRVLPSRVALFASFLERDAAGVLYLDRDIVIADPTFAPDADLPTLIAAFSLQGREIFVLPTSLPEAIHESLGRVAVLTPVPGTLVPLERLTIQPEPSS